MARMHKSWMVAALALGLVGACKKDEKKTEATPAGGSAEVKPGETKPEAEKPPVAAAAATAMGDDLSLIPADSELVMGLNFAALQKSALWKKYVEPQILKADTQAKLNEFKAKCGFDPLTSVQSVSLGLKGVGKDDQVPDGVIVVHGLDKAKTAACIDTAKAEIEKDGTKLAVDGGVYTFTKDGKTAAMTHVNDNTAILVIGANGTVAGVKAAAAGGSALKTSPAFVDMYSKIKTADSLWLLANGNSPMFDKAAGMGVKPKAVFGSVNVTDGLTVDMRVRLNTPDEAANLANMVKGQSQQAAQFFDKMDVGNEAADLKISLAMSTQKLQQLVGLIGGMAGGMGGGQP